MSAPHPLMAYLITVRRDEGLSQHAVARLAGISRSSIGNWESGSNDPTLTGIDAYAGALGLQLAAIDPPTAPVELSAEERQEVIDELEPVAAALVCAVHDRDEPAISDLLADLTGVQMRGLLVLLAAMVPDNQPASTLLAWCSQDNGGPVDDRRLRDLHRTYEQRRSA